jgi:hypothetical protein
MLRLDELEGARTSSHGANAITGQEPQRPMVCPAEGSRWPQESQSVDQPQGEPNMPNIVPVHSDVVRFQFLYLVMAASIPGNMVSR